MASLRSEPQVRAGDPTSNSSTRIERMRSNRGTPNLPSPAGRSALDPADYTDELRILAWIIRLLPRRRRRQVVAR